MISPGEITREEFDEALGRYPALIKSISASKTPAKEGQGQLTLEQLDKYRFEVAPTRYYKTKDLEDPQAAPTPLSHEDVVQLVRWKLKHGTFRPNLLKLAESNSADDIHKTTLDAFTTYKTDSFNPTKAIMKLTNLRGIGPATGSLLLSVHDASRVPFFSDELYQWICHDGAKATIKYNMKEYEQLVTESRKLNDRLGVDARDVEKVAFVLVKEAGDRPAATAPAAAATTNSTSVTTTTTKAAAPKEKKSRKAEPKPPREPTDMTEERKAQLQEIAEKARAARVAKRAAKEAAKLAKGTKFRERIDRARERKRDEPGTPAVKAGVKRKSEVTTRGLASATKRSRRSDAK